ncbi:three-helix bundle dimerization domain-containing protein [Mycetocola sp.]|uniref:three-helix bundle dimerization domain-containing protein n=1 Tax=Mycetocola sp. TaxID=1871042 RepID=UPI00398923DF
MTTELDDEEVIRQVIGELKKKFADRPPTEVEAAVREEFTALADRPVRDYLLILTERAAKERLKDAGTARIVSAPVSTGKVDDSHFPVRGRPTSPAGS